MRIIPLLFILFFLSCNTLKEVEQIDLKTNNSGLYSLIVQQNEDQLFKFYAEGRNSETLCNVQSVTKSIMAILVGIAIDEGLIESEEQNLGELLPELFTAIDDPAKSSITIKDILNQKTGLEWKGYLEHEAWLNSEAPNFLVLSKPMLSAPDKVYNYNTGATHLLSGILAKHSNMNTLDFARKYLFNPLGIEKLVWQKRGDGNYDGGGLGLKMRPSDLMTIGRLLLNSGKWNGEQVVSKEWLDKMFKQELKAKTDWGIKNSKHGYCWYYAQMNGEDIHYSMGYGGQFIFLIPARQLVIVSTFNHDTPEGIDQQIGFIGQNLVEILEKTK